MTLTKLYTEERRLTHSNLRWDTGVAEIGGADKVAPLWYVTEERRNPNLTNGPQIYGRVREGIVVVPADYALNLNALRAIVKNGLPLGNPEQAVKQNKAGKWYTLGSDEESVLRVLKAVNEGNSFLINESDVKDNVLEMKLKDFVSPLSIFLFGGDSGDREDRTRKAGEYFAEQFKQSGKSNNSVKLYIPQINVAQTGEVVGTQIWSGGLDIDFCLYGDYGDLGNDNGVFGVSE